jgi:hypothetical protein
LIRFLTFLLGRQYETCKSCETLKEQLLFERDEKKRLTDILLEIIKPKVVEAAPVEINQIASSSALFSRRRAALEAKYREEAQILKNSTNLAKPDFPKTNDVNDLERELGVSEEGA